jgi:hypothetical protein
MATPTDSHPRDCGHVADSDADRHSPDGQQPIGLPPHVISRWYEEADRSLHAATEALNVSSLELGAGSLPSATTWAAAAADAAQNLITSLRRIRDELNYQATKAKNPNP